MKNPKNEKIADTEYYTCTQDITCAERLHTDTAKSVDYDPAVHEIVDSVIMSEEEYNETLCANCAPADFDQWFADKHAKVKVVLVKVKEVAE